jgi:hypothetical protein
VTSANEIQIDGDHYKTDDGDLEHWDWAIANDMDPLSYAASKYVVRCYKKKGAKDIRKAWHYMTKVRQLFNAGLIIPRGVHRVPLGVFAKTNRLDALQRAMCDSMVSWRDDDDLSYITRELDRWADAASWGGDMNEQPVPAAQVPVDIGKRVYPTGWVGYTFEGCTGTERSLYRCKACGDLFSVRTDQPPYELHDCAEATSGYVDQDR